MRKYLFLALVVLCSQLQAVTRVTFPDDFENGWEAYKGQTIEFKNPMYVIGVYYDSLILAPHRLHTPEEHAEGLAQGDSSKLFELRRANRAQMVKLQTSFYGSNIYLGACIQHLKARVVGDHTVMTGRTPFFTHNKVASKVPSTGKSTLVVCGTNIENYFYDLGGYAGAKTKEQFALQTLKIAKGFRKINADLYAICEMERGDNAPKALVAKLNEMAKKDIYDFVDNGFPNGDTISVCWIYRKDKVRPYGDTYFAYKDPTSHYHYRLLLHAFEEVKSGERFIISLNHPKSKRGNPVLTDSTRTANLDSVLTMINQIKAENLLGDEDILMLGDYNCYTMERPIQLLYQNGFEDMLMKYAPDGYSYVYHSEAGYLDRCFASPTMASQVVSAHPFHINTDCYYSLGYKKGRNKTMYRYSDHDPIVVGLRLGK